MALSSVLFSFLGVYNGPWPNTTPTIGNDELTGTDGINIINGGAGHDKISGLGGSDTLNGGDDSDQIYGGAGLDILIGGNGNDYIEGGVGIDQINGGGQDMNGGDSSYDVTERCNRDPHGGRRGSWSVW